LAEPAIRELNREDPSVNVTWCAFELRPDPVPTLDPKGAYLQKAWRDSVYPLAEQLNVPMSLPPLQPRSLRAHEAAHWARTVGHFDDYNAAIFRAFFERGEDIGNVDVLVRLASMVALDEEALRIALKRRDYKESVLSDERDAARYSVRAVPSYVLGQQVTLSGVQPLERLKDLVAWARKKDRM
jgi:predicted DsbA family dithiol-disulfide isomerase